MPTIYLPKKTKKKVYNYDKTQENEVYKYVYHTRKWQEIRLYYLQNHPLCEECSKDEIYTLAEEVHHKYAISNGKTIAEKQMIGFDPKNLMSVCKVCHHKITVKENNFN
jgi:5-methylcytosine-specific restriction protein A